jgi:hypothetical protein
MYNGNDHGGQTGSSDTPQAEAKPEIKPQPASKPQPQTPATTQPKK